MLAKLEGHSKCVSVVNLSGEVVSLIRRSMGVCWLAECCEAWNIQTQDELNLTGPVGQVFTMVVYNGVLFAGTQEGTILAWKSSSQTNCPELAALLKGHSGGVVSLVIGADRLYSGSLDHTIRVWDLNTFECIHTLNGHTDAVMSVLCCDSYLLSSSLVGTIKGVLELCGIHDAEAKPVLLCSCNDNSVRLYDLPSFMERGRLFAKQEARAIQIGPAGLFFTGDAMGQLAVWKLAGEASAVAAS